MLLFYLFAVEIKCSKNAEKKINKKNEHLTL